MATKHFMVQRVRTTLSHVWFYFWSLMTDQCKRMCVLASLYARLTYCTEDDLEALKALNTDFKLSRDVHALRFLILIAPWIWRNVLPLERINSAQQESYIARLVRKTPCWLLYGTPEARQNDIRRLFMYCVYSKAAAA